LEVHNHENRHFALKGLEYMTMLAKDKAMPTMSLSTQAKTAEVCPFSFLGFRTSGIGQFKISTLWAV
jgi:hypothetical protein